MTIALSEHDENATERRSTRQLKTKKGSFKESDSEGSSSDADSDASVHSDASEQFEEEKKKSLPVKQPTRKRAPASKSAAVSKQADAVFTAGVSLEVTIGDWIDSYRSQDGAPDAIVSLLSFLLDCAFIDGNSGAGTALEKAHLEGGVDEMSDVVSSAQTALATHAILEYPLVSNKKDFKKFHARFIDFWMRWSKTMVTLAFQSLGKVASQDEMDQVETLQDFHLIRAFLFGMAASSLRAFRHTATVASLTILTSLAQLAKSVSSTKQRQNEIRRAFLEAEIVFVHRYRDIDPNIRKDCIQEISKWVDTLPDYFMSPNVLRYLGWMLSDKAAIVRTVAVNGMADLLRRNDSIDSLRPFLERFRARIVEMAVADVETPIRTAVISTLLPPLYRFGILEEEDQTRLLASVVQDKSSDKKSAAARYALAPLLIEIMLETHMEPALEAKSSKKSSRHEIMLTAFGNWVGLALDAHRQTRDASLENVQEKMGLNVEWPVHDDHKVDEVRIQVAVLMDTVTAGLTEMPSGLSASVKSLWRDFEKMLGNWEESMTYLVESDDMEPLIETHLLQSLTCQLRHRLKPYSDDVDAADAALFERHTFNDAVEVAEFKNDTLVKHREAFVRAMIALLPRMLEKYDVLSSQTLQTQVRFSCVLEMALWSLVGMNAADEAPVLKSVDLWMDYQSTPQFESTVSALATIWSKLPHGKLVKTAGKIMFGTWFGTGMLDNSNSLLPSLERLLKPFIQSVCDDLAQMTSVETEDDWYDYLALAARLASWLAVRELSIHDNVITVLTKTAVTGLGSIDAAALEEDSELELLPVLCNSLAQSMRALFYFCIWHPQNQALNKKYLELARDYMRIGQARLLGLRRRAIADAKTACEADDDMGNKTFASIFGVEGQALSSDESGIAVAALEKLIYTDDFMMQVIFGREACGVLPATVDWCMANDDVPSALFNEFGDLSVCIARLMTESFGNLLANGETGYMPGLTAESATGVDLVGARALAEFTHSRQHDHDCVAAVLKRTIYPAHVMSELSEVLRKSSMALIRYGWMRLNRNGIKMDLTTQNCFTAVLSWCGRWNEWMDEMSKIVLEQLVAVADAKEVGPVIAGALSASIVAEIGTEVYALNSAAFVPPAPNKPVDKDVSAHLLSDAYKPSVLLTKIIGQALRLKSRDMTAERRKNSQIVVVFNKRVLESTMANLKAAGQNISFAGHGHAASTSWRTAWHDLLSITLKQLHACMGGTGFMIELVTPADAAALFAFIDATFKSNQDMPVLGMLNGYEDELEKYLKLLANIARKGGQNVSRAKQVTSRGRKKAEADESENEDVLAGLHQEDDLAPRKKTSPKKTTKRAAPKKKATTDDGDDDDDEIKPRKKVPKQRSVAVKKAMESDHDDEGDDSEAFETLPTPTAAVTPKKRRANTQQSSEPDGDSDADSDGFQSSPEMKRLRRH